ncbi:MAG: DUF1587 domain-containing protein, partial [Planctomycetota bacterium]
MSSSPAQHLERWRQVILVLEDGSMPPEDAAQPGDDARREVRQAMQLIIDRLIARAASDPGPTHLRRMTNAEYEHALHDLTGVPFDVANDLIPDSVGASGFTNAATGQFMQADTMERYLEIVKLVADHAVIGAGPLYFAENQGATGRELASINKIKEIYRRHGFRNGAGEGAKPFGMDIFQKAFEVAWRHRYRVVLGHDNEPLADLAERFEIAPPFAQHIWDTLNTKNPSFPLSELTDRWHSFPSPDQVTGKLQPVIDRHCQNLDREMQRLQSRFASSASAEEEKALLTWSKIQIPESKSFLITANRKLRRPNDTFTLDLNDPSIFSDDGTVRVRFQVEPADQSNLHSDAAVVFQNPVIRFQMLDRSEPEPVSIWDVALPESLSKLNRGHHPKGGDIGPSDFVVRAGESETISLVLPERCRSGTLRINAKLDPILGRDRVVRCVIEDITGNRVRSYSSLLRDQASDSMQRWEDGLENFASALPQISHREPAPSDRDPIPGPYDATYNSEDRNFFHTAVKYHRDDGFLVRHLLPASVARQLNLAWTDLLTSFDYHNIHFQFALRHFG